MAASDFTSDLIFWHLNLTDLSTIEASKGFQTSCAFQRCWGYGSSSGIQDDPEYELQLGTNNLGSFMFTKLLTPTVIKTAKVEQPDTVCAIWVSSSATEAIRYSQRWRSYG